MLILLEVLLIVSTVLLLIGLVKPKMLRYLGVSVRGKNKKTILIVCGFCVVLFSILTIIEKSHEKSKDNRIVKTKRIKKEIKKLVPKYSVITVTSFVYKNGNIEIQGKSDLPNDSKILINIMPVGEKDNKVKLSSVLFLENGKFKSIFKVPQKQEWYTGTYKIEIKFFLDMQTDDRILRLIGNNGKNLTGKLVVLAPVTLCKSLQYSAAKEIHALKLKSYSIPNPKKFTRGEPKYVLACFLQKWKQKAWKDMVKYSDKNWVKDQKNPGKILESIFFGKTLIGAQILDIPVANVLLTEVKAKLFYIKDNSLKVIEKSRDMQLIKEDVNGEWGVFPFSAIEKNVVYNPEK